MPKCASSKKAKCQAIVQRYPEEFKLTPKGDLFCKYCVCSVDGERKSSVDKHRGSSKHQAKMSKKSSQNEQLFIPKHRYDIIDRVTRAFLSADIPLKKLRDQKVRELFEFMGQCPPSESACRSRVMEMADKELQDMIDRLSNLELFFVADETEVNGTKFFSVLVGNVSEPTKTYLVHCKPVSSVNSQVAIEHIDDAVKRVDVQRSKVVLLISDAARYMVSAGNTLKKLYPRLSHVTCVAHLLHNCAEKLRTKFPSVDTLIARVKAATTKNRSRQNAFNAIGCPPQPVVTRWASWLNAAFYYAENLPEVKEIVSGFEGGLLVSRAKEALGNATIIEDLAAIKRNYVELAQLFPRVESPYYTLKTAFSDLTKLKFGEDADLKQYLTKRIEKNTDLKAILKYERSDISPALYVSLQHCQATSVSVERCFSMLNKLLADDRNFDKKMWRPI